MSIFFHKGKENILESKKEQGAEQVEIKKIQDAFLKVLDNKNLSFLLGSGCSSYEIEIVEESDPKDAEKGVEPADHLLFEIPT